MGDICCYWFTFVSSSPITTTVGLRIIAHVLHTIIDTRIMAAEVKSKKKALYVPTCSKDRFKLINSQKH